MNQSIIADNWLLQTISELLSEGMPEDQTDCIDINLSADAYSRKKIDSANIAIEALFDFLNDIILRDQIVVETDTVHAWKGQTNSLMNVVDAGVIREFSFRKELPSLSHVTNEFVDRLCVTADLRKAQEANRLGWEKYRVVPDSYLSQVLWGGAGMLARSFMCDIAYTAHPIRRRLFVDTGLALPNAHSVNYFGSFISENRAKFYHEQNQNGDLYSLSLSIPPLPIKVIQMANSVDELIPAALELRIQYQELRGWLRNYQIAMDKGEYRNVKKFKSVLRSISSYVDSIMGEFNSNSPTYTTGFGLLKVAFKGEPFNTLKNHFGIRSTINKLIIDNSGNQELKKLLGFLGHERSAHGLKVLTHFSK